MADESPKRLTQVRGGNREIDSSKTLRYYSHVLRRNVRTLDKRLQGDGDHSPKQYLALAQMIRTACFVFDCIHVSTPDAEAPGWRMKGVS